MGCRRWLSVSNLQRTTSCHGPRSATESIFGGGTTTFIAVFGMVLSIVTLAGGWLLWNQDDSTWQSVLFTVLIFGQLGLALEVRAEKRSLFSVGLLTNKAMLGAVGVGLAAHLVILYLPWAQRLFGTEPLDLAHFALAIGGALVVMGTVEIYKVSLRRST